jgi:acyl carrier protein
MVDMTENDIRQAIAEVVKSELKIEPPVPTDQLAEHLDSLQRLTLIVALEDRLRVKLDFDATEVRTLDDLVRMVLHA